MVIMIICLLHIYIYIYVYVYTYDLTSAEAYLSTLGVDVSEAEALFRLLVSVSR